MNINIPFKAAKRPEDRGRPVAFGVLVLVNCGVVMIYGGILRWWWIQAERTSKARRRAVMGTPRRES
jgi:hypothetical protein